MSPPNETCLDPATEALQRSRAIRLGTKLLRLAARNDAPSEALNALRKAREIVAQHGLAVSVTDPTLPDTDSGPCSLEGDPWTPALVEQWACRAALHCVEAARFLAEAGYPMPGTHLNKLAGVPDMQICVLGGLQRWATVNGLPHPLMQDEWGGWLFVSPAIRAAFRCALAA